MLQTTHPWVGETLSVCSLHVTRFHFSFFSCDTGVSPVYRWEHFAPSLLLEMQEAAPPHISLLDCRSSYTSHLHQHLQLGAVKKLVYLEECNTVLRNSRFWVTIVVTVCFVGLQFRQESSSQEIAREGGGGRGCKMLKQSQHFKLCTSQKSREFLPSHSLCCVYFETLISNDSLC